MTSSFDPDALLAALPRRVIRPIGPEVSIRSATRRVAPSASALFDEGSYNGFTGRERGRTADLSNWLVKVGSTERPAVCDICSAAADDEHAVVAIVQPCTADLPVQASGVPCSTGARCPLAIGRGSCPANHSTWRLS